MLLQFKKILVSLIWKDKLKRYCRLVNQLNEKWQHERSKGIGETILVENDEGSMDFPKRDVTVVCPSVWNSPHLWLDRRIRGLCSPKRIPRHFWHDFPPSISIRHRRARRFEVTVNDSLERWHWPRRTANRYNSLLFGNTWYALKNSQLTWIPVQHSWKYLTDYVIQNGKCVSTLFVCL